MKGKNNGALYQAEYAAMNGCNWMLYCVAFSFAGLFLLDRGYSSTQMGLILAAANVLALPLQPVLADIADRSRRLTLLGLLSGILAFLLLMAGGILLFSEKGAALTLAYVLLLMGVQGIQPLVNSFSFYLDSWGAHINFGLCRAVGSLGFAAISVVVGKLAETFGVRVVPGTAVVLLLLFLLLMGALRLQRGRGETSAQTETDRESPKEGLTTFFRRYPRYDRFLIGVALIFTGHTFVNNFLIHLVQAAGGGSGDLGTICAVTALLEIPGMAAFAGLARKFRGVRLLRLSLVVFTVKLALALAARNLAGLYVSTLLQLISYGLFIPASVQYSEDVMAPGDSVKGQAFITTMITIGAIFSSLAGGRVIDLLGIRWALTLFLALSVAGTVVALTGVEDPKSAAKG